MKTQTTQTQMIDFVKMINNTTFEYLKISLKNKQNISKVLTINHINAAFDDMYSQAISQQLNSDQITFINQINYFNRKAILKWLSIKNSLELGQGLTKKDIDFVFEKINRGMNNFNQTYN